MAKITDPDNLNVGTEIFFDLAGKLISLSAQGNLVAKDGVTGNALWAKFVDLWTTSTYQPYPFPMNVLDARSGQYIFGQDPGGSYNGWRLAIDQHRQMVRDAGWSEYNSGGTLTRQYVGIVGLASGYPLSAQFYYQRQTGGSAINFTFQDAPNEAIQVYGDASNGNFDTRTYFKLFSREPDYTYDDAILTDVGETETGPYKISLPVSVGSDLNITNADYLVSGSPPYSGINVVYFNNDQQFDIGGNNYPFRIVINGNNSSLADIYTKIQYLLRQNSDIDSGSGTVIGKTANALCYFIGSDLYTTSSVYVSALRDVDINNIVFTDANNQERTFPYVAAGSINFNSFLITGGAGYYRMYFTDLPGSLDYGQSGAITVDDADSIDITGTIAGATLDFSFDYDGNVQGGRTAGTDASVTLVAGNAGYAKPVVATGTLTRSKAISLTVTAEADRAYIA